MTIWIYDARLVALILENQSSQAPACQRLKSLSQENSHRGMDQSSVE